jgi:hypothetical protein
MKRGETIIMLSIGALGAVAAMSLLRSTPAVTATPVNSGTGPVVVELFTSQGCSSCPPADAYMAELARDPGVVAISRPVTYWDRLGWKDTLARPENTNLQRDYAQRGGVGAGVYTPQMVVQGSAGAVGSDRVKVRALMAAARGPQKISIMPGPRGVTISGVGKAAQVRLVALQSISAVKIGRGENGGRVVKYSNVLRGEKALGRWSGGSQFYAVPEGFGQSVGADRRAIIVQQDNAGPILAARYLP